MTVAIDRLWTTIPGPDWAVTNNAADMNETLNGTPVVAFSGPTHGNPDMFSTELMQTVTAHGAVDHPFVSFWVRGNWITDLTTIEEIRSLIMVLSAATQDLEALTRMKVAA